MLNNPYIIALRPHQWLKNLLVFVPVLTAHKFGIEYLISSLLAFIAFSLMASGVYVVNDLTDIESDRAHPRKRFRPFASGAISAQTGQIMAAVLFLASLCIAAYISIYCSAVLFLYLITAVAYSLFLKKRPIIDICCLAGLYTIRIVAGGAATAIPLSVWLLAFSVFFFLSLAAVKRQAELVDSAANGALKAPGRGYHVDDLPVISNMALTAGYVSVLIMALYIQSPEIIALYNRPYAIWGICLVLLYWCSRIVMITHRGAMHDDPIVFAMKDRVSYYCLALITTFFIVGVIR